MHDILQFIQDNRIQVIAVSGSFALFLFIIRLIQKRKLKEEYALLWLISCVLFLIISLFNPILDIVAQVAGIIYPPAALLLLLIIGIVIILIHYSTVISTLSDKNKTLVQELALLRNELERKESEKD